MVQTRALLALSTMRAAAKPALICAERICVIAPSLPLKLLHTFIYRNADAVTVNASPGGGEIETKCGVARERIRTLVHEVRNFLDKAHAMADLYQADPQVTPERFLELTHEVLSRSPGFRALAWAVPVREGADGYLVQQLEPAQELLPGPGTVAGRGPAVG